MDSVNSPLDHPPSLAEKTNPETNLEPIRSEESTTKPLALWFTQVYRWTKGFLEARKLPFVAHKACDAYLGKTSLTRRNQCRHLLSTRLALNPIQLRRFFHSSLGKDLLVWLGRFFHVPQPHDQTQLLRDVLVDMATDPEGVSLLSFLRRSPHLIQPNLDQALLALRQLEILLQSAQTTVETIRQLSLLEAQADPGPDFSTLMDIRKPGPFQVQSFTLSLEATSPWGGQGARSQIPVFCYQPQPWPDSSIPVIIQSHGLASTAQDLAAYAQHLASYGYFVAAPQHQGSDVEQARSLLAGQAQEVFQLAEFIDRPLDVRALLDDLERRNAVEFAGKLNLRTVGMMGYSFGAYTALALAGADLHLEALEPACSLNQRHPNLSLLLQCQALELPRQPYRFRDDRIQAVVSLDSIGSELFGAAGIANIQVPVLLIAGDQDIVAPFILEQMRIFRWLTTDQAYLALLQGKSHLQDGMQLMRTLDLQLKTVPPRSIATKTVLFEQYIQAMSLAFFNQHLQQGRPMPPISAAYACSISHDSEALWLVSQLSRPELTQIN